MKTRSKSPFVIYSDELLDINSDREIKNLSEEKITEWAIVKLYRLNVWRGRARVTTSIEEEIYIFLNLNKAFNYAESRREKFISFSIEEEFALAVFSESSVYFICSDQSDPAKFCSYAVEGISDYYTPDNRADNVRNLHAALRLECYSGRELIKNGGVVDFLLSLRIGEGHVNPESLETFQCFKLSRPILATPVAHEQEQILYWNSSINVIYPLVMQWESKVITKDSYNFPIMSLINICFFLEALPKNNK